MLKLGVECAAGEQLDRLTELSRYVDDVANVEPNRRLPFVGDAAFAHKGGIHVHAIAADPRTYEHLDPGAVGNRAAHRRQRAERAQQRDRARARARARGRSGRRRRRRRSPRGSRSSRTRASSSRTPRRRSSCSCAARRTATDAPFEALAYAVDSRKGKDDDGSSFDRVGGGRRRRRGAARRGDRARAGQCARAGGPPRARPRLPAPRARRADRLPRHDRAQPRGDARSDPRPPHRHRAREPSRWTTVGSSSDLLHSAWLALTDCLEYAILTRAGIAPGPSGAAPRRRRSRSRSWPRSCSRSSATRTARCWSGSPRPTGRRRRSTSPTRRIAAFAAHATALGVALFYNFGNFCAIAAHPRWDSVKRVNLVKGRPENQVGSLTSTRDRFERLFDWSLLPDGLDQRTRARADGRLLRARPDGLPRPGGAPRSRPPHLARRGAADDAGDRPRATAARRTRCSTRS